MSKPSSQSTRSSLVFAIGLLVAFFFVWEHFDIEERLLGYSYSGYVWQKLVTTVKSIPAMLEAMLESLRNIKPT